MLRKIVYMHCIYCTFVLYKLHVLVNTPNFLFFPDVFGLRPVPGSLKAVRALEILGIIFLGIAVGVGFLKLTVKKHLLALFNVAGGLAILAGNQQNETLRKLANAIYRDFFGCKN